MWRLRWAKVIKLRCMRIEEHQSPEAARRMVSVMSSMMSGIAPDEDEAHVRDLRELTNGIGAPRQPYYKRRTAVANPSPTYYRGFRSLVLLRMYIRLHCVACRCTQMCTSSPLLELVWLIHYEVLLAYLSQVQWDLSCHVVTGWWTYNRNLQPVYLPVDLLDVSISIRRCGQREMYSWEEGREDLFDFHLCKLKADACTAASEERHHQTIHARIFDAVLDPQTCTGRGITFTISKMKALTGR